MRFRYLDHTADVMFEAYGTSLGEAFANSAIAMFNILTDITKVKPEKKVRIRLEAGTPEKLLFDFLDELIFYLDTKHMVFSKINAINIKKAGSSYILECDAWGDSIEKYERHGDIKAPTYNQMSITEADGNFTTRIVVDI